MYTSNVLNNNFQYGVIIRYSLHVVKPQKHKYINILQAMRGLDRNSIFFFLNFILLGKLGEWVRGV